MAAANLATSIFLAKLIGPVCLALGVALAFNGAVFRALAQDVLNSQALIFFSGILSLPAGLAIVLTHNVWTPDWRAVITLLGWLALAAGLIRTVVPQHAGAMGRNLVTKPLTTCIGGGIYIAAGVLLCWFGYLR